MGPLREAPLLVLRNMPGSAQELPTLAGLDADRGVDLEVFACSGCGLVQLASEPVPYYREVIRSAGVSPVLMEEKRLQYTAFIRTYGLEGQELLEVGCGRGEFLAVLAALPVAAVGLEFSRESVRSCRESGLLVFQGYPEQGLRVPGHGPFGGFLLQMFLEHMPDPRGALQAIGRLLHPGAVGLVEVPNFDAMVTHGQIAEFVSDHLLYFSRRTLTLTLQMSGYDVIDIAELRDGYVLAATVRLREPTELSGMHAAHDRLTRKLLAFIRECGVGQVAVWGAGHQALAVLAMSGIADAVRYVIDSSPFKQGRFTPATHRPIVPPDTLRSDPVNGVIVMAGGYSEEVASLLASEYGSRIRVAVLRGTGLEDLPPRQPRT